MQMKGIPTLRCVLSNLTLSGDSESRLVTTSFPSWNVPDYHLAKHARFSAAFLALLSMTLWCIQCQCLTHKGGNCIVMAKRNTMLRSKKKELRDDTCQLSIPEPGSREMSSSFEGLHFGTSRAVVALYG